MQRAFALCAAGLVFGSGATVTSLAATGWSDLEWVSGGVAGGPGFNTSIFNVNQNATDLDTAWGDFQASPGNVMSFSVPTAGLSPGQTVYAFVRLRTVANSLGGDLELGEASEGTGTSAALFAALRYQARIMTDRDGCNSTDFSTTGSLLTDPSGPVPLDRPATTSFPLAPGAAGLPGPEKTVCFALSLPSPQDPALQGTAATPIWYFSAESS